MKRIALISDTHNLVRAEAVQALGGAEQVLHAGDICGPEVLDALALLAPVTAVRGNNDRGDWAERLPETTVVRIDAVSILIVHDLATLSVDPASVGARVVLAGHTHRARVEHRDGVLYVNPGSAGPRRFGLPVSVGELLIRGEHVQANLRELTAAA
jgi:putative phosphoesterase